MRIERVFLSFVCEEWGWVVVFCIEEKGGRLFVAWHGLRACHCIARSWYGNGMLRSQLASSNENPKRNREGGGTCAVFFSARRFRVASPSLLSSTMFESWSRSRSILGLE